MKFVIDLSADELEKLASIANKKNESMHKTGADVIREFISRPTPHAPDGLRREPAEVVSAVEVLLAKKPRKRRRR